MILLGLICSWLMLVPFVSEMTSGTDISHFPTYLLRRTLLTQAKESR